MAETAFVAGATGYTGSGVVTGLLAKGFEAVAHIRPDSSSREVWTQRFAARGAVCDFTPWEQEAMTETLRRLQPQLIFAALGTTAHRRRAAVSSGGPAESYETVDYGLTAMLVKAAIAAAPQARFVYCSALGAGPKVRTGYYRSRYRAEQEVVGSGLAYTIVRPTLISGADRGERRFGERVAAVLSDGLLSVADRLSGAGLRQRFGSTTGEQLGRAMVRAAVDPAQAGKVLSGAELSELWGVS